MALTGTTMPLVQIHGVNEVRIDRVPTPVCGEHDVIVQVQQCGICGSDLGYIAMGGLLGPGKPMPIGHELSGVVREAGSAVTHLTVGDRVVVNPEGAGNRIGNSGPEGGFAPFLLVRNVTQDAGVVLKLPDSLDFETGALVEPLSVAMHAVHQSQAKPGDRVVVFGAGPIGLGIVMVLRYYGIDAISVVDRSAHRLQVAETLGAQPFTAGRTLAKQLIEQHGAAEFWGSAVPAADIYIEATGVGSVFQQIVQLAKPKARIVVVGVHKAPAELDMVPLLMKELVITGSMAYPEEFPQVIAMLESGKVNAKAMVSHRFALGDFPQALAMAQDQEKAVKVLISCNMNLRGDKE